MLKYLHFESLCNIMFGIFLATWLVARHGIYNSLCYSIYRDIPRVMPFACYSGQDQELDTNPERLSSSWRYLEPFFDQKGTICFDRSVKWVFLGLLLMLQLLSIVWFGMIVRVALSVLKGEGASDTRSGDEDESDEIDDICDEVYSNGKPTPTSSATISSKGKATGSEPPPRQTGLFQRGTGRIRVPGSRDRKELIGRVGCNG